MNLLGDGDSQQLESHLAAALDRLLAADGLAGLSRVVRRFVLAGGKRIRPQLCLWTWSAAGAAGRWGEVRGQGSEFRTDLEAGEYGGSSPEFRREGRSAIAFNLNSELQTPDSTADLNSELQTLNTTAALDLACAWELFHAFLLAHDDVIDNADERRDAPSLHRQLAGLDGGSLVFGTNLAIVAGDLLFGAAMRLLHELDVPAGVHRDLLRLFSRVVALTGFGQAIDICAAHAGAEALTEHDVIRGYLWKTAAYTFEGPMLSGAILAGAGPAEQAALSRYALALGQAYQLQNDLSDLSRPACEGCDLVQGKRTVTLARARAAMPDADRRDFDARLAALRTANGQAVTLAEGLRHEIHATGALGSTGELIDGLLADARDASEDPALSRPLRRGLGEVLDTLAARYFVAPLPAMAP